MAQKVKSQESKQVECDLVAPRSVVDNYVVLNLWLRLLLQGHCYHRNGAVGFSCHDFHCFKEWMCQEGAKIISYREYGKFSARLQS